MVYRPTMATPAITAAAKAEPPIRLDAPPTTTGGVAMEVESDPGAVWLGLLWHVWQGTVATSVWPGGFLQPWQGTVLISAGVEVVLVEVEQGTVVFWKRVSVVELMGADADVGAVFEDVTIVFDAEDLIEVTVTFVDVG